MSDLYSFAEDVWTVEGPRVRAAGIPFGTRMIIVRLTDGSLWINSPVPVPSNLVDGIAARGPVKYLVAPTKLHVWRLAESHARFPNAELWAPPQVPRKFKDLPFAGVLGDSPPVQWTGDLDQLIFEGNLFIREVEFFHPKSRTLIFGDFIQNHRAVEGRPLRNALFKLAGALYPHGGVPIDIRLSFTHRKRARQSLEKLLSWDFDKLIPGHGVCIEKDAKAFVERAFRWLLR